MLTEILWRDFLAANVFTPQVITEAKKYCPRQVALALKESLIHTTPVNLQGVHLKELVGHLSKGCLDGVIFNLVARAVGEK